MPFDPKKSKRELFKRIFALGFFWGSGEPLCRQSIDYCLSPVHSDITRFHQWSPNAIGSHLDCAEKIQKLLRRLAPMTFLIRIQAFRDSLRGEFPHFQILMNDGPNPLT